LASVESSSQGQWNGSTQLANSTRQLNSKSNRSLANEGGDVGDQLSEPTPSPWRRPLARPEIITRRARLEKGAVAPATWGRRLRRSVDPAFPAVAPPCRHPPDWP
jgi:hypothetical protein